ncbi:MAG: CPBP family intramembrane metalloprotease [Bacteroidales bacterium]|nr:CPBP family intramembrane metalloprotease [Bacteroidales bacterium]
MRRRGNYQFLGKFSWYVPGAGGIAWLAVWLLVGALLGAVAVLVLGAVAGPEATLEYGTLISYPLMFIPPMTYAAVKSSTASMTQSGIRLDSNNFLPLGGLLCAVIVSVGTLSMSFWADALCALLPPMPEYLEAALSSLTQGNILLNLLCVSIFAPVCEEWLCRGMVLRGLLAKGAKPAVAICASALFFAIIHLNPWQALPAFLLGCLFGYVYYKTGSLKLTMLMHCVNNTAAVLVTRIPGAEEATSYKDIMPDNLFWIILAASVIITALTVLAFRRIPLQRASGNLDPVPSIFDANEN